MSIEGRYMDNIISFPIGKYKVKAGLYNYDGNHPELSVYIEDENGCVLQDICLVRNHVVNTEQEISDNDVDCIVWADSGNEDYTNKFVIPIWKFEEDAK